MRSAHFSALIAALSLTVLAGGTALALPSSDQSIDRQQRLLRRNPSDAGAYHRLGEAYIQKSRETGDLAYLDLAEQALRKALAIAPAHAGAARHLAYVLSLRHEFAAAASQALRAVAIDPGDAGAFGVLGDAYLELGFLDHASEAFDRMIAIKADLASYSRRSGLRALLGDPAGSIEDLRRAVASARSTAQPRESIAWAEWQLGAEHFAVGQLAAAEAQYQVALETYPGYYRALAGLGHIRAAQGRDAEAIELFGRALAVAPYPEYAAALGDVYTRAGRLAEAAKQYELVEYIGRLNALNQVVYNRELAYFYADHDIRLESAVRLAEAELESRRDVYGLDVLAWTLHKAGRSHEAVAPMEEALRFGTRDAKLFFHAGLIQRAVGNRGRAREYLTRAMAINPHFHVLHARTAERALAELAVEETQPAEVGERENDPVAAGAIEPRALAAPVVDKGGMAKVAQP